MERKSHNKTDPSPAPAPPEPPRCRSSHSMMYGLYYCLVPEPADCKYVERHRGEYYCFHPEVAKFTHTIS